MVQFALRVSALRVSALGAVALALAAASGCGGGDGMTTTCVLDQHPIAGSPLTLLPDARLDAVGDHFVLLGSDETMVRWATLSQTGTLGAEHEIQVPEHDAGPWFAVAGSAVPGDRLIVAYVAKGAGTGMGDLMTFAVQSDGTLPMDAAAAGKISLGAGVRVTMASARGGMRAGIAWGTTGSTSLAVRLLDGDGRVAGDLPLGTVGAFDCLRFLPGKGDLTVGYLDESGTPPVPVFTATEIAASGAAQTPFRLQVGREIPECVDMTPAETGYGLAWHTEGIGFSFGVFDPAKSNSFPSRMFLGDVRFLPAKAPPLGGLGWMGKNYAIGFARTEGAEIRLIDAAGNEVGKLPVFPSTAGHTGTLSTQPVGTALYATYADYPSAGSTAAGRRFLVKVSCP